MSASRRPISRFRPEVSSLEDRIALSTQSVVGANGLHLTSMVLAVAKPIKGNITGGQISLVGGGHLLVINNLKVNFGKLSLTGTGYGTYANGKLVGGTLHLSGKNGTLTSQLIGGSIQKVGKNNWHIRTTFVVEGATGGYTSGEGSAGTFTIGWSSPKSLEEAKLEIMRSLSDAEILTYSSPWERLIMFHG
jgi:hypothetical protein